MAFTAYKQKLTLRNVPDLRYWIGCWGQIAEKTLLMHMHECLPADCFVWPAPPSFPFSDYGQANPQLSDAMYRSSNTPQWPWIPVEIKCPFRSTCRTTVDTLHLCHLLKQCKVYASRVGVLVVWTETCMQIWQLTVDDALWEVLAEYLLQEKSLGDAESCRIRWHLQAHVEQNNCMQLVGQCNTQGIHNVQTTENETLREFVDSVCHLKFMHHVNKHMQQCMSIL